MNKFKILGLITIIIVGLYVFVGLANVSFAGHEVCETTYSCVRWERVCSDPNDRDTCERTCVEHREEQSCETFYEYQYEYPYPYPYEYQYQYPYPYPYPYQYPTPYSDPYDYEYEYQYQYQYQTPTVDIKANNSNGPVNITWNTSANLSWTSSNVSSCNASGDWSGGKPLSGSESTGNLSQVRTYNYTLACTGGSASDNVQVVVNAPIPTTSSVSVVIPDYCTTGPSATVGWDYSDPSGSPQLAYQVQIDDQGGFGSPEVDSGKVSCQNCRSYYGGLGVMQFNTTYRTRVRTWNQYDSPSSWQNATSCTGTGCLGNSDWKTPQHAYPNPNSPYQFTWSPTNPPIDTPVQFTDRTLFAPGSSFKAWSWTFVPAGGGSGSSTDQNPVYSFNSEGIYQVTERVTDDVLPAGQFCTGPTQAVNVQKPIPVWKEVAPK